MTEEFKNSRKSRRRFLADMLFLGGGATAAAFLAKSVANNQAQPSQSPTPFATPAAHSSPEPVEIPVHPDGEMMIPDGDVALPQEPVAVPEGGMIAPDCAEPMIKGKVAAPEPPPPPQPPEPPRGASRGAWENY